MRRTPRVGLLWREEWDANADPATCKLRGVFAAFGDEGVAAEPVIYADAQAEHVREHLSQLDAALVWVNPVEQGKDRSRLNPLLADVAAGGVFVSAHPDVIARIATKRVLVDTRDLGWGSDTRVHETREALQAALPPPTPVVLKELHGMGGIGVWKVEDAGDGMLAVQHAAGGAAPGELSIDDFVATCTPPLVEQPFQERLADGLIRAYLTHDRVVGFTHQYPRGLMPPGPDDRPATKLFEPPGEPRFQCLRRQLEEEWVPQLQARAGVATHDLPVIWDADFLFGDDGGHVLCEINASSTFAFPEQAMPGVARATLARI